MSSDPQNECAEKAKQILEAQMENASLMNAVAAAAQTETPFCCCYRTTVVQSFATLADACLLYTSDAADE